jgi:hypothetical protein
VLAVVAIGAANRLVFFLDFLTYGVLVLDGMSKRKLQKKEKYNTTSTVYW